MDAAEKISQLRSFLVQAACDAFILPVTDEFQGEYSAEYARRVTWLTGFDGSAGAVVVLPESAGVFVDGRYTLQAAREVDADVYEVHNSGELTPLSWALPQLTQGAVIGFDAWLHTPSQLDKMNAQASTYGVSLKPLSLNPIDALWAQQPARPMRPMQVWNEAYAGATHAEKRAKMARHLEQSGADALLITQPDALCWLLNIRGEDVPFNPLPLAYGVLLATGNVLVFAEDTHVTDEVRAHLGDEVQIIPIAELDTWLHALGHEQAAVMVDSATIPYHCYALLEQSGAVVVRETSPLTRARAVKNAVEIEGMRYAHRVDGIAVVRMLMWLDGLAPEQKIDELTIERTLEAFRARSDDYRGASFATIAGAGEHGAIVHYRANTQTNRQLRHGEVLLLDSGGQYPYGTTDITRTVVRGGVSDDATFKEAYTRVLKGHIALARAQFPRGTSGSQLDVLARNALWLAGMDYDHGTGHGVGCYLCVHEGPQRISKRGGDEPLSEGMVLSNEPGYYPEGQWGIRIENLMHVVSRGMHHGREWLGFEPLTLAPIDTRLVMVALLNEEERAWLNAYHQEVYAAHAQQLDDAEATWLAQRCAEI
jgi:Xaa-Pro aminopeptidase